MKYKKFAEMISLLKEQEEKTNQAYKLGVDLLDFNDNLHTVIDNLLIEVYGKEGAEWISWFRFESNYGKKDWSKGPMYRSKSNGTLEKIPDEERSKYGAHDENGKPICYSVKSTWEYLEKNYAKNRDI